MTEPRHVEFPRAGYQMWVRDDKHAYHRAGKNGPGLRMPGASTVAKAFPDRPDGLMYWVETMTLEGIVQLPGNGRLPSDPYALRSLLERHGLRWPQLRDAAAQRGTDIHRRMLQALAKGDEVPDLAELPEEQQGYGQAVFRWWEARQPKPLAVEQEVLSVDFGYAGRFDLRCAIEAPMCPPDGIGIVDLKTSKKVYRADHIQLRLYDLAAEECGIGEQDWLMLLQVCPDGSYIEHWCAADRGMALDTIGVYGDAKRLDKAMKGAQ